MTLPASGSISASQVNVELGRASTATLSFNDAAVRNLAGAGANPNPVSMSQLRGKSAYTPVSGTKYDAYTRIQNTSGGGIAQTQPYVVAANGTGSYTYSWSFISGGAGLTLLNATSAQCTVRKSYASNESGSYNAMLQCVISDGTTSVTLTNINAAADWGQLV